MPLATLYGFVFFPAADTTGTPASEGTPFPYAPIAIGPYEVTAAPDGWWSVSIPETETVAIKSPLKALAFTSINETPISEISGVASELSLNNPYVIRVTSRIVQGPVCKLVEADRIYAQFPFTYRSDDEEPVRVDAGGLNNVTSASQSSVPPSEFQVTRPDEPEGTTSFKLPIEDFQLPDGSVSLAWYLLGSQAPVSNPLPLCEARGDFQGCSSFNVSDLDAIFRHVTNTAITITNVITIEGKKRKLKFSGKTRRVFLQQVAPKQLRELRALLASIPRKGFVCGVSPLGCNSVRLPKKEMMIILEGIFQTRWPPELKPIRKAIVKVAPDARNKLSMLLKRYPDRIATCDRL